MPPFFVCGANRMMHIESTHTRAHPYAPFTEGAASKRIVNFRGNPNDDRAHQ